MPIHTSRSHAARRRGSASASLRQKINRLRTPRKRPDFAITPCFVRFLPQRRRRSAELMRDNAADSNFRKKRRCSVPRSPVIQLRQK